MGLGHQGRPSSSKPAARPRTEKGLDPDPFPFPFETSRPQAPQSPDPQSPDPKPQTLQILNPPKKHSPNPKPSRPQTSRPQAPQSPHSKVQTPNPKAQTPKAHTLKSRPQTPQSPDSKAQAPNRRAQPQSRSGFRGRVWQAGGLHLQCCGPLQQRASHQHKRPPTKTKGPVLSHKWRKP